jgi:carboxyl-terminal processing protease
MKLLVLIILSACIVTVSQAREFSNPSFSAPAADTAHVARDWKKNNRRAFYDTVNAHTAPGCVMIYNDNYFESKCSQSIPFSPGKYGRYKLKIFIKTESRKGYAGAWIASRDAKGKLIYQNSLPDNFITGKKRWREYEVDFHVTADVASLEAGFYFIDKGKAWFDDISIEALPDTGAADVSKIARQYLGEVYEILDKQCWYRDSVDLKKTYRNALELVADAKSTGDCYPGVAYMLERLGDRLGIFYDPATARKWKKEQSLFEHEIEMPVARIVEGGNVYIRLPGIVTDNRSILQRYADTLHLQLSALDQQAIKGWVVDLRENVGGNAAAMLAAIGPVLDLEVSGRYIRHKGKVDWKYAKGTANIDTTRIKVANPYTAPKKDLQVAVLTSEQTYGAAELIAVAFKSRGNSRFFGEQTSGATYNERRVTLSDGAMLFFTAGIIADTHGRLYSGKIKPDVPVRLIYTEDHCLGKALWWLQGKL